MNKIILWLTVTWIVGICLVGMFAALIRWHALDNWCASQLDD